MILTFTIHGNQQDLKGNPIPYLRMTRGELKLLKIPGHKIRSKSAMAKREGIQRYLDWKEYVKMCLYFNPIGNGERQLKKVKIDQLLNCGEKVHMDCSIYFANKKHGDPDNIFKGIGDAIFTNDKHVVGSFDYEYDKDRPRVEVTIKKED